MFRHKGKSRTYTHNLRLAAMLSFVAGMVNISGVMALSVLTTNITGHFAYFSEEIVLQKYSFALVSLLYILAFLLGAFVSNLLIEILNRKSILFAYIVPMSVEILFLSIIALAGITFLDVRLIACMLLFAMGLQNALVTKVSNSLVRTTHLTGLFTDLGIELSQLIFHRSNKLNFKKLVQSIKLKLTIIFCFFTGCLLGGVLYGKLLLHTLLVAVVVLIVALFYDYIRLRYYYFRRKFRH
ncbi:MAG: DUF1275 domain-containing protein [Taibaiella sp.]|nr:DUF1275 domain-containing protein [Taibaiella sp.]